jgi:hypothetical protein
LAAASPSRWINVFDFLIACCQFRRAASDFVRVLSLPIGTRAISLPRESSTEIQPPCQVSSSDNSFATYIACASAATGLAASPACSKESPSAIVKQYRSTGIPGVMFAGVDI